MNNLQQYVGIFFRVIVTVFALCILNGCGATKAISDVWSTITNATLQFQASNNVNPDIDGRPSPILVRVYQLKSSVAFNNSDFFALYDKDTATLGADFVGRDDLELKPGERKELKHELSNQTRFIGIIAAYRNIDNATWKKTIEIEPDTDSEILVSINRDKIELQQL